MSSSDPRGRRALAAVSLCAFAGVLLAMLVFLARNLVAVIAAVGGLALAIASIWWVATARRTRRLLGMVGVVAGLGVIIAAVAVASRGAGETAFRLGLTLGLLALGVGGGHRALAELSAPIPAQRRGTPPQHPVLLCNPWSGGGKVDRFGLIPLAHSLGVETVMLQHGLDLAELTLDAVGRGTDCLGMAGGDGSQALVAAIAVEHRLPFVCISAGTRNHFALDLGLDRDDPRKSMDAFRDAVERRVDYATVNDRLFVNNVSLGAYATIVDQESYRDAKIATTLRTLPELLGDVERPFDLQFRTPDGTEVDGAFVIMVSNNPYVLTASPETAQRRRLDTGQLGIFAIRATTGGEAAEIAMRMLSGGRRRNGKAFQFTAPTFEVHSHSGYAYAGIDGEALELATPLRFASHPLGLTLLVPSDNIEIAAARGAREIHLRELISVVRTGRSEQQEKVAS
jgi:diacylglycerol kinase family enzyme